MDTLDLEIAGDIDQLRIIPQFNDVSEEYLISIFSKMQFSSYEEKETLINQGDNLNSVFFVMRGLVQASYVSYRGKVAFLRDFHPGKVFGEVAAFDGHASDATFQTLKKTLLGTMSSPDYRDICVNNPIIAGAALHGLAMRTRSLIHHVEEISTLGVKNRIHAELLRRGRRGSISNSTSEISPAPTHADIAFRVNTQREVVTKELNRLEARGIIRKTRSTLVIVCLARLEELVEDVIGARD
jgi:CRP-like cAMP-binding protein